RDKLIDEPFYRLIHAEADGLPGLIIDRFGKHLSVQLNTAGMDKLWPEIEKVLVKLLKPESIVLRNDSGSRALEGLTRETKFARGEIDGPIEIKANGLTYFADP